MSDFAGQFRDFFERVANGTVEIYNEISLQHELGIHLRSSIGPRFKVQFERPATFFGVTKGDLEKKEIDISIFTPDRSVKHAIELKYPRNGQYPEQMFKACQDIRFVEQLSRNGFGRSFFIFVADDPGFYSTANRADGIYEHFRGSKPIHGLIQKPTGHRDHTIEILGRYQIVWCAAISQLRYAVLEIGA